MQKRKQRTVPEALWRVYHNRARTLVDTILSFLPSPPPSSAVCRCKGRRCLGCAGDKALSFLLRAKDPPEYQKLLKKCFVAVDDNAPQFPGFDPCRRWHHLEIIKRSIEMIMSEQSTSSNMLCCGFDKRSRTSDTVELLDSSSWKLLLKRVGDIFLVYLLKNTSIFIPLPQRKYLQIAGFPISSLCQQVSNDLSCSQYRHFSQSILGRDKKIKACKDADRRSANIQGSSSARVDFHSIFSGSIIDLSELINASQSSKLCGEQSHLETLEVNDSSKSHEKFIQTHKMSRKRKRPTSWQRRRKHGQLNSVATNSEITDIETPLNNAEIELVKEEKQESSSARVDLHSNFSGSIIGCSKMSKKRKRPTSWQRRRKRRDLDSVGTTNSCVTNCETPVDNSNMVIVKEDISCLKENTSEFVAKPLRKNSRHYSWQRLGKNVKFNTKIIKESSTLLSCRAQQIIPFEKTQCDCCLKFQRLHKFNATSEIDRKRIFYKLRRSPYIFPRKHILNALPPTYNGARILFRQIFGSFGTHLSAESVPCRHHEHSPVKSTCLYHVLLKQLKSLIRKTQSCQHLRLLERHCAVTSIDQVNEGCEFRKSAGVRESVSKEQTGNIPYGHNIETCGPSNYVCLKKQVISFIWASCRSIIPRNMLGSPNNWRVLIKNISKFVCLRRFEKFTLRECMHKFKVSKYPLLLNSYSLCSARNKTKCEENIKKYKIIECWILWIFSEIVVPMIQANFYVTESEYTNQEVYYFRRSIWEKLACKGFTGLKDQSHIQLTLQSVRNIISARSFGFSRIRLLPKELDPVSQQLGSCESQIQLQFLQKLQQQQQQQQQQMYLAQQSALQQQPSQLYETQKQSLDVPQSISRSMTSSRIADVGPVVSHPQLPRTSSQNNVRSNTHFEQLKLQQQHGVLSELQDQTGNSLTPTNLLSTAGNNSLLPRGDQSGITDEIPSCSTSPSTNNCPGPVQTIVNGRTHRYSPLGEDVNRMLGSNGSKTLSASSNARQDLQQDSVLKPSLNVSKNQNQGYFSQHTYPCASGAQMDYLDSSSSATSICISQNDAHLSQNTNKTCFDSQPVLFRDISQEIHDDHHNNDVFGSNLNDQFGTPVMNDSIMTKGVIETRRDFLHDLTSAGGILSSYENPKESQPELSSAMVSQSFGVPDMTFNTRDSSVTDNSFMNGGSWPVAQQMPRIRTYTKVYKRGAVGRSIDITRYSGYEELKQDLARRFGIEGQVEDRQRIGWKLVYVDHENDVLLVGDDPWEEFVSCVRCIKILSPQEVQQMSLDGDLGNNLLSNQACSSSDGRNVELLG